MIINMSVHFCYALFKCWVCFAGHLLMISQWTPPAIITNTITTIGNCNTAFSMMVIGMILADADIMSLFNFEVLRYSLLRLIIMPSGAFWYMYTAWCAVPRHRCMCHSHGNACRCHHKHPRIKIRL